jgi:hypothetical protein
MRAGMRRDTAAASEPRACADRSVSGIMELYWETAATRTVRFSM